MVKTFFCLHAKTMIGKLHTVRAVVHPNTVALSFVVPAIPVF